MKNNIRYYAFVAPTNGKIGKLARVGEIDGVPVTDSWEKDHWEDRPGFARIERDITDAYPVTEEEADAIAKAKRDGKTDLHWRDYIGELRL